MKFSPEQMKQMRRAFNKGLEYRTVSRLLTWTTVAAYVVTFWLFLDWRYDLGVARACRRSYSQSQYCLDMKGALGWVSAGAHAVPFTAGAMLILIGLVYWLLGKKLNMRLDWGSNDRKDTVGMLAVITAGVLVLFLVVFGAVQLFMP